MLIVQKFGGSSVANAERVNNVARIVTDAYRQGNEVVVVVSAVSLSSAGFSPPQAAKDSTRITAIENAYSFFIRSSS